MLFFTWSMSSQGRWQMMLWSNNISKARNRKLPWIKVLCVWIHACLHVQLVSWLRVLQCGGWVKSSLMNETSRLMKRTASLPMAHTQTQTRFACITTCKGSPSIWCWKSLNVRAAPSVSQTERPMRPCCCATVHGWVTQIELCLKEKQTMHEEQTPISDLNLDSFLTQKLKLISPPSVFF